MLVSVSGVVKDLWAGVYKLLQLRTWLEFGKQSRDNKGEVCLRLTVNLLGLDYMNLYGQMVLCSSCNCLASVF